MGSSLAIPTNDRWTSADKVYHELYEQIASLKLMPGDKISEAEIAAQFGISRQPVRDAFSRLGNIGLVQIRPQKATQVKKFSRAVIRKARFLRLSVELEVLFQAAELWDGSHEEVVAKNLTAQHHANDVDDAAKFHALDYDFHKIFCQAANADFAMDIISDNKAIVDRLCMLSLNQEGKRMSVLIEDHENLFEAVVNKDFAGIQAHARLHLSRLNRTIDEIYQNNSQYFED